MKKIDIINRIMKRLTVDLSVIVIISFVFIIYHEGYLNALKIILITLLDNAISLIIVYFLFKKLIKGNKNLDIDIGNWNKYYNFYIDIVLFLLSVVIFYLFKSEFLFKFFFSILLNQFIIYTVTKRVKS